MKPHNSSKKVPLSQKERPPTRTKAQNSRIKSLLNRQTSQKYLKTYKKLNSELNSFDNTRVMSDYKVLGMIHAYRPDMLKDCLVSSKISERRYDKQGQCKLDSMFVKTALVTFREWRDKIYGKLTLIVDAVAQSDELLEQELEKKAKGTIKDLKYYSLRVQQQIEKLKLNNSQQSYKMTKLHEKYTLLLEAIEHVLKLVSTMQALDEEINLYLEQKRCDDLENTGELEVGVKQIAEKYQREAKESLNYCMCHPDNKMLLKLQYKVRRMFRLSTSKIMAIFQSLRQCQKYETQFKNQMASLQKIQHFSMEFLQHALETIYNKNEEIKRLQAKLLMAKQPKFIALKSQIQDWETNFIKKLRPKTATFLKENLNILNGIRTLQLIKNKGKEYGECKKRIIIVLKIYQESEKQSNINADYYEKEKQIVTEFIDSLSEIIKAISPLIQATLAQAEKIEQISSKKKGQSAIKLVEKAAEEIEVLQRNQSQIWIQVNKAYCKICRLCGQNPQNVAQYQYSQSGLLRQLHQILIFSKNEEQNNDIFKVLEGSKKISSAIANQDVSSIFSSFEEKYQIHSKFLKLHLQEGLQKEKHLQDLMKLELISYLFQKQFALEFIYYYPIIRSLSAMQEKIIAFTPKQYIENGTYFRCPIGVLEELRRNTNQQIAKLEKSKHRHLLNRYIVFMYQNMLVNLMNMRQIYRLFTTHHHNLHPYRTILHEYVETYQQILAKNVKQDTEFGWLSIKIYEISLQLNAENKLIYQYTNSTHTNQYYPSNALLSEWLLYEFSAEVEQTIGVEMKVKKRAEIKSMFKQFINKLQGQRERWRGNKLLNGSKDIYQHITSNLFLLKQFTFEENYQQLLRQMIQYLRALNITHSVIFAKDQSPIIVLLNFIEPQAITHFLFNRLHIHHSSSHKQILIPFQGRFEDVIIPSLLVERKQQNTVNTPVSKVKKELELDLREQIEGDEIEQIGEEIKSNLPITSIIKTANEPLKINSKIANKSQVTQNLLNQHCTTSFTYYSLEKISTLSELKTCLLHRRNQYQNIQSRLKIDILCKAFKTQQRSAVIEHIDAVLKQVRAYDLIRIMGISDTAPESQQRLLVLRQNLRRQGECEGEMKRVLEYFKIEERVMYCENKNRIVGYRKQVDSAYYVYADLSQNYYKLNLQAFFIDHIIATVWLHLPQKHIDYLQFTSQFNQSIQSSNQLLLAHYQTIQDQLKSVTRIPMTNPTQVINYIDTFIDKTFKNRKILEITGSLTSKMDILKSISVLQANLRNLSVLKEYFTFEVDDRIVYLSSNFASLDTISKCLLIQKMEKEIQECIVWRDRKARVLSTSIKGVSGRHLERKCFPYSQIGYYLKEGSNKRIKNLLEKRRESMEKILCVKGYFELYDNSSWSQLKKEIEKVEQQIKLLQFVLSIKLDKVQQSQSFTYNRDIQCKSNRAITNLHYYDPIFLQQLQIHLAKANISHELLFYKASVISIFEQFTNLGLGQLLSLDSVQLQKINQNIIHAGKNHTIKRLYVIFADIVPPIDRFEAQIKTEIIDYLKSMVLCIRSEKQTLTFNCNQLLSLGSFEVQVGWPKNNIFITITNQSAINQLVLLGTQYQYYSHLSMTVFGSQLANKYRDIESSYLAQKAKEEAAKRVQLIRREEQIKQLQKLEHDKIIQKLKGEEEIARIRLETEQIHRKMRERDVEERIKLQFIEEVTLKKLKQQYERTHKIQKEELRDKINHLSESLVEQNKMIEGNKREKVRIEDKQRQDKLIQDELSFQLILSDGEGEYFNQHRHTDKYKVEYNYRITLFQHIRQAYHEFRRKKNINLEEWHNFY